MNKIPIKLKLTLGFSLAFIGIGLFLLLTFRASRSALIESKSTTEELAIMKDVEIILNSIQNMEIAYQGYFITGDSLYLESYTQIDKELNTSLDLLANHAKQSQNQKSICEKLIQSSKIKKSHSDSIIYLKSVNDQAKAFTLFQSGRGRGLMDSISAYTGVLETAGRSYFKQANEEKYFIAVQTKNYFIILSALIFFMLIIFFFIISKDLDKNSKAQRLINEANDKIRDLYDNAPNGYLTADKDLLITEINKTALRWLEMEFHEVSNTLRLKDIFPEDPEFIFRKTDKREMGLISKSGKKLQVQFEFNETQQPENQFRIILIDLTEKYEAEQRINYFEDLVYKSSDAIISTDLNFITTSWNQGAERLYGYTKKEAVSRPVKDLINPIYNSEADQKKAISDLMQNDYWTGEMANTDRYGKRIYILGRVLAIRDHSGTKIGYVSLNQDITERHLFEEELKKLNKELQERIVEKTKEVTDTLERITDAVYSMDKNFTITFMNKKASSLMEYNGKKVMGENMFDAFPKLNNSYYRTPFIKALETQEVIEFEDQFPGVNRWFYLRIYPSQDGISVFFQDVSEKRISDIKVMESERKYQLLFQKNPYPMWILDGETLAIKDVNQAATAEYGYSEEQFLNMNFLDLSTKDEKQRSNYRNKFTTPAFTGVIDHERSKGEAIKMEVFFYDLLLEDEKRKIVVANNITDLLNYQDELKSSSDQLRQLSSYLEKIREEERTNIAREIHDELGQQLTGLKMDVAWMAKKLEDREMIRERIPIVLKMIDETVKTVRRIATELRPGILDDFGLIAALEWQSREFEKRTGIHCFFKHMQSDEPFDRTLATGIFRIYQEALTNVARHSEASEVNTSFEKKNNNYLLIVKDNGSGISSDPTKKKTLGLIGMKERAIMLNGVLNVSSSPQKGTTVELIVPVS